MTDKDLTGLIITIVLGLLLIICAVILLSGKGAFLIAGYNTSSKAEKEKYDSKALCRFFGKILLPIGICTPAIAIGGIYNITWISVACPLLTTALVIFAVIYCNTGNRFKK